MITLVTATVYYFKYNAVMYFNLEEEAPSSLYVCGDCWYVANAFVYTLCAIRDNDGFWFMPTSGKPQDFLEIARAHYFSRGERDGSRDEGVDGDGVRDGDGLKGEMPIGAGATGPGAAKVKTNGHGKKGHRDDDSGNGSGRERDRDRGSSGKNCDHSSNNNLNGRSSGKGGRSGSGSGSGSGSAYVYVGSSIPGTPASEDEGMEREIDWERVRGKGGVGLESNIDKLSSIFLVSNAGSGSVNYRASALSVNNNNNNSNSNNNNNSIGGGNVSSKERGTGSVSGKERERERESVSPKRESIIDSINIFGSSTSSTANSNTRRNQ
jgi:hypothetical protein